MRDPLPATDALPRWVECPYCGAEVAGYPELARELNGTVPEALRGEHRTCEQCDSELTRDGRPLQPHPSLLHPSISRWLALPLLVWLIHSLRSQPDFWQILSVVLLLILVPMLERVLRIDRVAKAAQRHFAAARQRCFTGLGGGYADVGERLYECDRRARPIRVQCRELLRQIRVVRDAQSSVARSRFRRRSHLYDEAATLLHRKVEDRLRLLSEFADYRRDLTAIVAARRAEEAVEPLFEPDDDALLDDERARLTGEADALLAAGEVAELLRTLSIGPLPDLPDNS